MPETIVYLWPMLILAGLVGGWAADSLFRAGGYGVVDDMAVGLTGSMLAGAILWLSVSGPAGVTTALIVGLAGAGVAIIARWMLWRTSRLRR